MAESGGMGGRIGALASNVDSKIYFLKESLVEYMDIKNVIYEVIEEKEKLQHEHHGNMAQSGGMGGRIGALASKVDSKIYFFKESLVEYMDMKNVIDEVRVEKERLQHEHHARGDILAPMEEELATAKKNIVVVNKELAAAKEEISRNKKELEVLRKKLQDREAENTQTEQQYASASESIQLRGVQTRSMHKRKRLLQGPFGYGADEHEHTSQLDDQSPSRLEAMEHLGVQTRSMEKQKRPSEGPLGNDAAKLELVEERHRQELVNNPTVGQTSGVLVSRDDDLEAVREQLIKGFLEIDSGWRKIGIKVIGELNEKAFQAACLAKLPPEEVGTASYELYSSWQQQLSDLSWNPFKTVTVDGNCQEIVNVDDTKLQELKRAWGEGAHKAVINSLMEMKDYNCLSDRRITFELWNYKEGRKATLRECVEYMSNEVKKTQKWSSSGRLAGKGDLVVHAALEH